MSDSVMIADSPARVILRAGLTCGVMDITAALVVYGAMGLRPMRLLQGIASGLMGLPRAVSGGLTTALIGLACHFVIAFSAAAVFVAASSVMRFLAHHPFVSGPLYGIAVYFFMQYVVLPLSAYHRGQFSLKLTVIGVVIHIFCVGLPIALITSRHRMATMTTG